ncbi:MAG: hypothetical protein OEZ58_04140 [Gammaproteobacteria bacterium]|nr:hypothetical protein [Gammaproteobacteria bacterium]MDH5728154.1 hypothetical protein [Gammaproteobacteria bacterium]
MLEDFAALDYDAVLRLLESYTQTAYGTDYVRKLRPAANIIIARERQRAITAAAAMQDARESPDLSRLPNIFSIIRNLKFATTILSVSELSDVLQIIARLETLMPVLRNWPPLIKLDLKDIELDPVVKDRLVRCIDFHHREIIALASPELAVAWESYHQLQKDVQARAQAWIEENEQHVLAVLSHQGHWHGERLVFEVREDAAEKVSGVYFGRGPNYEQLIEPFEMIELNNQLEVAAQRFLIEEQVVLRELSALLSDHLPQLDAMLQLISQIDFAFAAVKLAQESGSIAPRLEEKPGLQLKDARHPILNLQQRLGDLNYVIPYQFKLSSRQPLISINGEPMSGKTLCVKTIGLLVLMAKSGLFIPVAPGSSVGWYSRVFVSIGDKQSLYHQLSTTSAKQDELRAVVMQANQPTLVLIDDLHYLKHQPGSQTFLADFLSHLLQQKVHVVLVNLSESIAKALDLPMVQTPIVLTQANIQQALISANLTQQQAI